MSEYSLPLAGRRILLVEDEYVIAAEMMEWLRESGAVVIGPVPTVSDALDLIQTGEAIDAAVLDISLGDGETIYPVADLLKQMGVPFLFATGDVNGGRHEGHEDRLRLEKPILKSDLLAALGSLMPER